jgi:hypothetical protein
MEFALMITRSNSFSRGVHLINGRKQVLIQDEINASAPIMWRAHTNATISISSDGFTATLAIGSATTTVHLLNPPSGAAFTTMNAVRFATDPTPPLVISLPAGSYTLEVLINPQWPGMSSSSYTTPGSVALSQWSLTSPS